MRKTFPCIGRSVEKMSYVSLMDRSPVRRIGIAHLLGRQGLHVEPFEDVSEFLKFRPAIGLVLVHDEDSLLVPLVRGMAREQCWYPHVVYSEEPQWQRAVDAVTNGAMTYVAFPDQIEEIQRINAAVRKVVLANSDSANRKAKAKARIDALTPREIDVLEGVIAGYTNRLIAKQLRISARTVEVHRANLLKKMNAKNGADLVRIAVDADFFACQPGIMSGQPHMMEAGIVRLALSEQMHH
jgi:two-component system, LuxR family, response regulator FixJ